MKILHIISGGDKGGAKTHMFALLDELCKLADVTVVCLMQGVFYQEILERPVHTVLIEQKSRFDVSVVHKLSKLVNEEKYDIVNAHGARANFVASRLQKHIHIPVCTTIHSDYLLDFDVLYKKVLFTSLNLSALKKIKYKIAVSDAFKSMLISRGFMPNDIETVYNGMDFETPVYPISKEEFAQKYNVDYDPDNVYIGIAARFDYVKGVDVFLKAAKELYTTNKNVRFVIAGEGDEKDNLVQLTKELGIDNVVYFVGFVSPVYDFLNFIDINSLTSRSESFPYSLLEGAKLKKATVAANVGGISHLIINGNTGYTFENENFKQCAAKWKALVENSSQRNEFANSIYEKATNEFSNLALAKSYLKNYESFIRKYNRKKRYDVVLAGYYGYENLGDDIIISTIVNNLKQRLPDCEMVVLSANPEESKSMLLVDSLGRRSPRTIKRAITQSRIFVYGGGTLLTDITSVQSLVYYSEMIRYAKNKGLTTMLLSNGIGPFGSDSSKKTAMKAIYATDIITLRDKGSYNFIKNNFTYKKPLLSADITFLNEPDTLNEDIDYLNERLKISGEYMIISIREMSGLKTNFVTAIASACDEFCQKNNVTPLFIPMQNSKDMKITKDILSKMKVRAKVLPDSEKKNPMAVLKVFSGASITLAMRLHALIFSASFDIPVVALNYDIKVENFMNSIANDCIINPLKLNKTMVLNALQSEYDKSKIQRANYAIPILKERANEAFNLLIDEIQNKE